MTGDDWTPEIGWRIVGIRILWAGLTSMVVTLGTVELVVHFFSSTGVNPGPDVPSVGFWGASWFSGCIAVVSGIAGGVLISRKLVDRSNIMGAPLVGVVAAGLCVANLAAWRLGVAFLGAVWDDQILFVSIMAAGTAILIASLRIYMDS